MRRLVIIALVLILLGVAGYGVLSRNRAPARASALVRVDYLVKGTARQAAVTYRNAQGGTEQRTVLVPWELRLDMPRGAIAVLSAHNQGGGTIECRILVGLDEFKRSTSEGEYKIATCSGAVP